VRVLTAAQSWRQQHFETAVNSGDTADSADPDGDGIINLLERDTLTDPLIPNTLPIVGVPAGATRRFGHLSVTTAAP